MDGPDMLKHNLRRQERSVKLGCRCVKYLDRLYLLQDA
jgi:hypothetical protein